MASFKNIFIKSKMNKDLDDRLLPQGEYRNAVNIQVSKSESEDVGALENVLGNEVVFDLQSFRKGAGTDLICIGYLVSEVDSSVFLFLTDNTIENNSSGAYDPSAENFIVRLIISPNASIQSVALVQGAFLNFYEGNPIYGVNLLEDLLFWTDNRNQPRKIRVSAAADDTSYYNIEDTISVAKYMPYNAPVLWQDSVEAPGSYETTMKDVVSQNLPDGAGNPYYNANYQGDPDYLEDKFARFSYRFKFDDGEYSVFAPFTQECFIPKQDGYFLYTSNDDNDMSAAYRSTVVDFMENKVNQIDLLIDLPEVKDPSKGSTTLENVTSHFKIVEIDILYKESDGLAVAVVDTITPAQISAQFDSANPSNTYKYTYSGTKPFRTLPEDQLIRVYDKVPVKALGQEIISNRIVYSNFQTKHTPPIINYNVGAGEKKDFNIASANNPTSWNTNIVEYPNSTLKQNRSYQAGFVLSDRFSRTTSTILSNSSDTSVSSSSATQLSTIYSDYNPSSTDIGSWPGDSLFVNVEEPIETVPVSLNLYPGVYNGDPSDVNYNPLGFYTWKVVVKQQEQDYYNVYLPGALTAYPKSTTLELGLTSHITLLNDNINKVPRDLSEVGPDQKQFRSSVKLFGRVENTNQIPGGFGVVNKQYFPSRFADTVSTVSNMFDMFNIEAGSNYDTDYDAAFYEAESNPLIGRVSTSDSFGQIDPQPSTYSIQNLAVYETEPVESRLDIYWETSSSGTISDLNDQIQADGNQTITGIVGLDWNINEYFGIDTDFSTTLVEKPGGGGGCQPAAANGLCGRFRSVVTGQFQFESTTPGIMVQNIVNATITVTDENGLDVSSQFELVKIGGTNTVSNGPGRYEDYNGNLTPQLVDDSFVIVNKTYRQYTTANADQMLFTVVITAEDPAAPAGTPPFMATFTSSPTQGGTEIDNLPTIIVGGETFNSVDTWGRHQLPVINYQKECPPVTLQVPLATAWQVKFYGSNGANRNPNDNQNGLVWNIAAGDQTQNGQVVDVFEFDTDPNNIGELKVKNSTTNPANGEYDITVTLTGSDGTSDSCNFNLTVGEELADGSFSVKNKLNLVANYAYILSAHDSTTNPFSQLTSGPGNSFTEMYPSPQSITNTNLVETSAGDNSTCLQQGGQPYNYLERNQIPSGASASLAGPLTKGTAYISLQGIMEAYTPSNIANIDNHNDISWAIEYRPTSSDQWEAAIDVEGNVLSFNNQVSNYINSPQISNNTATKATYPISSSNANTNIQFGSSDGTVPGNSYANWFRTSAWNRSGSSWTFGNGKHGKWAVVGKSPYGTSYDKFGEYRVIVQRIGGKQADCQSCEAPIGSGNTSQINYAGAKATFETGDFYYDLGDETAFGYRIKKELFENNNNGIIAAKNNTSYNETVFAREGIHRYVTKFYTDATLQTEFTGYVNNGNSNKTILSYAAVGSAGTDSSGNPYTTAYSNGPSASLGLALSAEGANFGSSTNYSQLSQENRNWICQMNVNTNKKVIATAQRSNT